MQLTYITAFLMEFISVFYNPTLSTHRVGDIQFSGLICKTLMQFLWSNKWAPQLTTKFGCSVEEVGEVEEVGSRWVGWDINWCEPWVVVNESILKPSYVVISSEHLDLDRALKSPSITQKDNFNCFNCLSKLWVTTR